MRAVHWLRSRQEERELNYWLALVAYDPRDRSLNNRIYLLYLLLFFGILTFVTLTFFAAGGAAVLRLIDPLDPARAAVIAQVLLLSAWFLTGLWQALRRSPVAFSEEDAGLVCQTPVRRAPLTLRWLLLPWLTGAVPFWLAAAALGFAVAEVALAGELSAGRIFEYAGYGLRAWLALVPVHLGLMALQWAAGVARLRRCPSARGFAAAVFALALGLTALLLAGLLGPAALSGLAAFARRVLFPLWTGLGAGSLPAALLASGLFAAAALAVLYRAARRYSLSRAAQETQADVTLRAALRYGLTAYARDLQLRRRLGTSRQPSRLPGLRGPAALVWKDLIQSQRALKFQILLNGLSLFVLMFSLPFLPDVGSQAFALAVWVIQVSKACTARLRSDLACWPLVRQLPVTPSRFLLFDLSRAYITALAASWGGLGVFSLVFQSPLHPLAVLLPGAAAAAAGAAAFDVIRRSRSSLLVTGFVPDLSGGGVFLGIVLALAPFLLLARSPGLLWVILAALLSLICAGAALGLAAHSYRAVAA